MELMIERVHDVQQVGRKADFDAHIRLHYDGKRLVVQECSVSQTLGIIRK
jgi:hypothetical protein